MWGVGAGGGGDPEAFPQERSRSSRCCRRGRTTLVQDLVSAGEEDEAAFHPAPDHSWASRLGRLGVAWALLLGTTPAICCLQRAAAEPFGSPPPPSRRHEVASARQLSDDLCCPLASIPEVSRAVEFDLEPHWKAACQKIKPAPGFFFTSHWKGQDTCWSWVKKVGCYDAQGTLSWREGQQRAADMGLAPQPEVQLMPGLRSPDLCERRDFGALSQNASESESRAAAEWLRANVRIFVVNLDRDVERLSAMRERLAQLELNFTRVPGVDLSLPGGLELAHREGLVPEWFNFTLAQANANTSYQGIGGILGTVGCAAAHLSAMRRAVEDTWIDGNFAEPLALILEDDVALADDVAVKLRRLLQDEAPCDWKALSLQSRCPYGKCVSPHLTRVEPDGNEPEDRCRHGVNYGFFAMLYRVNQLAQVRRQLASVVWNASRPRCLDVDVALASISDEVPYYAVPAVQQPGFLSLWGHNSSRGDLNKVTTTTTSMPRPTATQTSTTATSTTTFAALMPAIPAGHLPVLMLGDGHYITTGA